MASSFQIKEAILITPSDPTPTRLLHLSALDSQLFLRFTFEYLLLYTPPQGLDRNSIVARIKTALARALVPYYPLAGRVRANPDGSGLQVVCRAQGAAFVEALCSNTLSDFERAPHSVTQWRKLLSLQVADVLKGGPPLVVQLTWLSDGSAALGVGFSHCLCDGVGSVQFLDTFAKLATDPNPNQITQPVWERHLLDSRPYGSTISNHPEFNPVSDLCSFMSRFTHKRLTPTSVTFESKRLNELKKVAAANSPVRYTSFEVLSAHIWRSWATSLNLPENQILKLLFSIDIRNRVKPSLPSGYYGNAIVLGCAETTVREFAESSLGEVAEMVRRAKERVGDEYVKEVVESVSGNRWASPDSVGVLVMSQWSNLGLEGVDFGMGKAVHVGPVCNDRYCLMVPVEYRKEGVKVMVAVPNYAAHKYLNLLRTTNIIT